MAETCQTSQPTCSDLREETANERPRENCIPQMLNWNPLHTKTMIKRFSEVDFYKIGDPVYANPLSLFPNAIFLWPRGSKVHARYDWTTGVPDNGNVWGKYRVVPRAYPSHPPICANFHRVGNKERFRLPGAGGGALPLYSGPFARSYSVLRKLRAVGPHFQHTAQSGVAGPCGVCATSRPC